MSQGPPHETPSPAALPELWVGWGMAKGSIVKTKAWADGQWRTARDPRARDWQRFGVNHFAGLAELADWLRAEGARRSRALITGWPIAGSGLRRAHATPEGPATWTDAPTHLLKLDFDGQVTLAQLGLDACAPRAADFVEALRPFIAERLGRAFARADFVVTLSGSSAINGWDTPLSLHLYFRTAAPFMIRTARRHWAARVPGLDCAPFSVAGLFLEGRPLLLVDERRREDLVPEFADGGRVAFARGDVEAVENPPGLELLEDIVRAADPGLTVLMGVSRVCCPKGGAGVETTHSRHRQTERDVLALLEAALAGAKGLERRAYGEARNFLATLDSDDLLELAAAYRHQSDRTWSDDRHAAARLESELRAAKPGQRRQTAYELGYRIGVQVPRAAANSRRVLTILATRACAVFESATEPDLRVACIQQVHAGVRAGTARRQLAKMALTVVDSARALVVGAGKSAGAVARFKADLKAIAAAEPGARHATILRAAFRARLDVRAHRLPVEVVDSSLRALAAAAKADDLSDVEASLAAGGLYADRAVDAALRRARELVAASSERRSRINHLRGVGGRPSRVRLEQGRRIVSGSTRAVHLPTTGWRGERGPRRVRRARRSLTARVTRALVEAISAAWSLLLPRPATPQTGPPTLLAACRNIV